MKSKNNPTIIALSVAVLFLAGCNDKKDDSNALDILNNVQVDKKADTKAEAPQPQAAASTPTEASTGSGSTKRAASYPKSDSSISNQVAIAEIEANRPYTSIVSEVEGFRARPYSDVGQGFAVGNGWNMSFQSAANNRAWATKAGIAEPMIKAIVSINGRMQGAVPAGIEITPAQATTVAEAMRPTFEGPAIKLFGQSTWNKLQEHQKAVLVYHTEKVGPGGAAKYKGLIKAVQTYANSPTDSNAQAVVSHITYDYKIKYPDGSFKQMHDTRSQLYIGALFVDPQQYRYLLGKATAPTGFAATAKTAGFNIDSSKAAAEQVAAQDQFNKELDTLADQGIAPSVRQEIDGKTNTYSMDTEQPQTKTVCLGKTTICHQEPINKAPTKQPAQPQATVAPTVEVPKVQGSCKAGSYEATMKLPNGSDLKYCVIKG
ncbi:TPA: hypothetical protein ACQVK3_001489 [Serratia marcescens]|uniref:Lipoprotein n=1 Tax=Serratia nevei TaxID=2703794 RepID=A0ABT7G5N4_9GAMM|nr:hypothetical protein [Serratia nevei]HAU4290898.1 hypothetical protein [Serratia marcescens]MDK5169070.1 hypothetical protein [Serratia nevei]MDK5298564.1 hypothetical protein [Serratia nevei]MEC5887184.1 hypothetical protein [Serratia nevei]HAU4297448.1 hypothetical protein [Serratia marcescens]